MDEHKHSKSNPMTWTPASTSLSCRRKAQCVHGFIRCDLVSHGRPPTIPRWPLPIAASPEERHGRCVPHPVATVLLPSAKLPTHHAAVILPILIDNWEGLFTIMSVLWRFSEPSVSVMAITDRRPLMIDRPSTPRHACDGPTAAPERPGRA